ncbi:MAG: type II secretion system protein [Candidatus Omnitrophica bacterium]|nr:type II secretion system protein [Candidatus Omnitrophota bacterium]
MKKKRGFTLLELIVVIVILGILATLGFTQYDKVVETMRRAEAKVRIGNMRQLVTEYYLKHGSLSGLSNADLGTDNTCTSSGYYKYFRSYTAADYVVMGADRCTSGGKTPDASRGYLYYILYYPASESLQWCCTYTDDWSKCFGGSVCYSNPPQY